MNYQVLFSLKNNEEIFMNVVYCSCDWRFMGKGFHITEFLIFKATTATCVESDFSYLFP